MKIKWLYVEPIPYTKVDVTKSHFEKFKASDDYVIKLNGKYISEKELNTYKASDFITFSVTPISELAKMKEYFVLNLVTPSAYEFFIELMLTHYNLAIEDYEKEISLPENKRKKDIKELISIYEFLKYNYSRFTTELIRKHNLKSPSPISSDVIKKVNQSYLDIPILFIDENENIFLNKKSTSLETIKEDFNNLTKFQKSELILEANGRRINENYLDKIMIAIGDNLKNIKVANGQALVFDPDYKSEESVQKKPIMWILINRKDQLLVDDELGTLEIIDNKLKKLAKEGKAGQLVSIKYDKETSKDIISKVEELVKTNNFKVASFDVSKIPPPPPPPPTPKKTKGGPNLEDIQEVYNPSFIEYIEEMEQEGASFYFDNKKITAKQARSIAINNNGKRIGMITQKDTEGNYLVKLSSVNNKVYARSINVKILNDNSYIIDGIKATKRTFKDVFNQLHQDITSEIRNKIMNIHVTSTKEISNKEVWFIYNSLQDYGFYRIVTPNQEVNRAKGNMPFAIESNLPRQEKATAKQVAEYNAWAKQLNASDNKIIKRGDLKKYTHIYGIMTAAQKKASAAFPKIPPPPPPPTTKPSQNEINKKKTLNEIIKETPKGVESGYEMLENGESHYFTVRNNKKTYYNSNGYITDKKGNVLPPPPPVSKKDQLKEKTVIGYSNETKKDSFNKNPKSNSNPQSLNSITVKGYAKPSELTQKKNLLPMVNGKTLETGKLSLNLNDIKKLKLTSSRSKITDFKFKIPGIKTELITGSTITKTTMENLNTAKIGDYITLFDIKDDKGSKFSPIVIEIIK
jgi:biopolymer transport protein ExbD